jgi:outer membrane protein assembly factor BamA
MGNHRIFISTSLVLDLRNSDYSMSYLYLPKRIDYGFGTYHSARFLLIDKYYGNTIVSFLNRYRTYGAGLIASYPLSKFNRIESSISYNRITRENLDLPDEPMSKLQYILPTLSLVHDNTLYGFTSPIRGKRLNITLSGTPKIGAEGVSFFSAVGDYRTYIRFLDEYNLVWRLNGGFSIGTNPQSFYIGGTEGWINYELENNVYPNEEIDDFAFSTPIMPMRGYNYNYRTGSKFVLMNTELRFPLFKYMVLGLLPIAFQNIQGVLFTDIGTVWTNNKELQLFQDINGRTVTKDLIIGMGAGIRIFLLYFPLKFDVAWSYDLHKFSVPKYYFSMGVDF